MSRERDEAEARDLCPSRDCLSHDTYTARCCLNIAAALHRARQEGRRAGREEMRKAAAASVPTNWVDPLLTGPSGMGPPPWGCLEVEPLLNGVRERIAALSVEDDDG